jgi:chromosome partitioning protein
LGKQSEKVLMTYTIAVVNHKGGVAKTTTTLSLGGAFASLGYEVLVVDLDVQGNLTTAVGLDLNENHRTIVDIFFQWAPLTSASRETPVPGLDIVPSHPDMSLAERFLPVRNQYEKILRRSTEGASHYDVILFDCPPSLGAVTLNALYAAQLQIIPTVPEIFSWESLHKTIRFTERIKKQFNPELDWRILITMLDVRLRIHREITQQYHQKFGSGIFHNLIQVDNRIRESAVAGLPVTQYAAQSRSAQQYLALAQEILIHGERNLSKPIEQPALKLRV